MVQKNYWHEEIEKKKKMGNVKLNMIISAGFDH